MKPPPLTDADQIEIALLLQAKQRQNNPLYTVWLDLGKLHYREAPWCPITYMGWMDAIQLSGWPKLILPESKPVSVSRNHKHKPLRPWKRRAG